LVILFFKVNLPFSLKSPHESIMTISFTTYYSRVGLEPTSKLNSFCIFSCSFNHK
jgi:hypothetical protein